MKKPALSRYESCASLELFQALERVLRYIQGTLDYSLVYKRQAVIDKSGIIVGYADADWAGDKMDRK